MAEFDLLTTCETLTTLKLSLSDYSFKSKGTIKEGNLSNFNFWIESIANKSNVDVNISTFKIPPEGQIRCRLYGPFLFKDTDPHMISFNAEGRGEIVLVGYPIYNSCFLDCFKQSGFIFFVGDKNY